MRSRGVVIGRRQECQAGQLVSPGATALVPLSSLDEDAWDDLISFIEERRVIPIIGPELLLVQTDQGPRLLHDWLAGKLAQRLNVDVTQLPQPYTLNDVVCWFLGARGRREEAYVRLRGILKDAAFEPPLALRQLAAIPEFDLFVTTTFDALLENAINQERFGGASSTEVLSYSPNRVTDLPTERDRLQRPVVYHLFGRISASPTYVISDEDLLEYICALQSEHLAPEKLFHELEHNHLLFIGSNFSNWLARLFLRMAKRQRLSDPRDVGEVLADDHSGEDERLVSFLQQVSVRTRIYVGAERFVHELHDRLAARRKPAAGAQAGAGTVRFLPPAREMPDNAVFISYAREDLAAVQQLKAGLEAAGVTTWFDMERLESGDDYDLKIQRNIARCSYFIPVVSAATQRRHEAYFRREWSYALDRARNMADGALFVLPVTIDATTAAEALVPDRFKALHFTQLQDGVGDARFRGAPRGLHAGTKAMNAEPTGRGLHADRRAPSLARPRFVLRGNTRASSTAVTRKSPSWAPRAAQAPDRAVRPVRPREDVDPARRASCRACAGTATARSTSASPTRPMRPSPASRSSRPSCRPRATPANGRRRVSPRAGESLWEFLHHRDDVLLRRSRQAAHPAPDLRPVRGDLHARPDATRPAARAPRASSTTWRTSSRTARRGSSRRSWRPTTPWPSASTSRAATTAC